MKGPQPTPEIEDEPAPPAAPPPAARPDRPPCPDDLASRVLTLFEQDVLALLADGLTNLEIADRLAISVLSTRVIVNNIVHRLGAAGRDEAAALARQSGLHSPPQAGPAGGRG